MRNLIISFLGFVKTLKFSPAAGKSEVFPQCSKQRGVMVHCTCKLTLFKWFAVNG